MLIARIIQAEGFETSRGHSYHTSSFYPNHFRLFKYPAFKGDIVFLVVGVWIVNTNSKCSPKLNRIFFRHTVEELWETLSSRTSFLLEVFMTHGSVSGISGAQNGKISPSIPLLNLALCCWILLESYARHSPHQIFNIISTRLVDCISTLMLLKEVSLFTCTTSKMTLTTMPTPSQTSYQSFSCPNF